MTHDAGDTPLPPDTQGATLLLAAVSSPYEANVIEAQLIEADIPYEINRMASQFGFTSGDLAGAEIYVASSDIERARHALTDREQDSDDDYDASMAQARLERRFTIARLFLYMTAAGYLLSAFLSLAIHILLALTYLSAGVGLLILAFQSRSNPRRAFLQSFFVAAGACLLAMLAAGELFVVLPGYGCLIAVYFAYKAAREQEALARHTRQVSRIFE